MGPLYRMAAVTKASNTPRAPGDMELKALEWIKLYLTTAHPVRLLDMEAWHASQADMVYYADACPTGLGVWFPQLNICISYRVEKPFADPGHPGVTLHIGAAEMFAQFLAIHFLTTHAQVQQQRVLGYTDNQGVRENFYTLTSALPINEIVMQQLVLLETAHRLSIRVYHIPGKNNIMADWASRGRYDELRRLAPSVTVRVLRREELPPLPSPYVGVY